MSSAILLFFYVLDALWVSYPRLLQTLPVLFLRPICEHLSSQSINLFDRSSLRFVSSGAFGACQRFGTTSEFN